MSAVGSWGRLCLAVVGIGILTSCRGSSSERAPEQNASSIASDPAARSVAELTTDSGASDAGPNCTGAGDPLTGLDGGASCTGSLAASLFQYALCSCTSIQVSGQLNTDGYDSAKGPPGGGLGGNVGFDTSATWSNQASIGGNLWSPGGALESSTSVVRGDLHLGGTCPRARLSQSTATHSSSRHFPAARRCSGA
jgi:hypothetical protein